MKSQPKGKQKKIHRHIGDVVMSNTVYVNKNYPFNDLNKMIFVSIVAAYDYIIRYGAVSSKNKWRILCAPGEDVSIVTNPNVYVWDGSMQELFIPLSNTVWINTDLAADDTIHRIFKSYPNAVAWIQANGSLSALNQWQVYLPGGITPVVIMYENIRVVGTDSSIITTLSSSVDYSANTMNYLKAYISGVQITGVVLAVGKCIAIENSIISNVSAPLDYAYWMLIDTQIIYAGEFESDIFTIISKASRNVRMLGKLVNISGYYEDTTIIGGTLLDASITGGNIDADMTITGDVYLSGVNIDNKEITVASGGKLKMAGCFNEATIIGEDGSTIVVNGCANTGSITSTGTLTISGNAYDNTVSGLESDDNNEAIDEIVDIMMGSKTTDELDYETAITFIDAAGSANVGDAETVTINAGEADEEVYTFKTVLSDPAVAGEVLIGADIMESMENLALVITGESSLVDGIVDEYLEITASTPGSAGNLITVETTSLALSVDHSPLTGGDEYISVDATKKKFHKVVLNDDSDIRLVSHGTKIRELVLEIHQDVAGGHTPTISSEHPIFYVGGIGYTPTADASAFDILKMYCDGTSWYITSISLDMAVL